jgi:competence protein ComEC
MAIIHYLNVKEGDCSVIEHNSERVTVIDVCNAKPFTEQERLAEALDEALAKASGGNFQQKKYPVNPIVYLKGRGIESVHRFIVTHPDMDHLDGIEAFFDAFSPLNLWDTDNEEEKDFTEDTRYSEDDWNFYKNLRDTKPNSDPKRLTVYSGQSGQFWNKNGADAGDGLHVLAPTPELLAEANKSADYNDSSYVVLYRPSDRRIVFGGDAHDKTWEHILKTHKADVTDIDLLVAPHHGRKSNRSYDFLDVLKPKLTFFGNANSERLAYNAWDYRKLQYITNNQANCMVVSAADQKLYVYVTNESFARKNNAATFYSKRLKAWYYSTIE